MSKSKIAALEAELAQVREELTEQCKLHELGANRELKLIAERNALAANLAALRKEYDDYINGKPGEWYIVLLKSERNRAVDALAKHYTDKQILQILGRID